MKYRLAVFFLFLIIDLSLFSQAPARFEDYFTDQTLRIDYFHTGDAREELISLDQIYRYGTWAGNPKRLLDTFNYGRYALKVHDAATGKLIFSQGFDTYFGEYKTSDPAVKGFKKTYHESLMIPAPQKPVKVILEVRNRKNELNPLFTFDIDPKDQNIWPRPRQKDVRVFEIQKKGSPHVKVDVAVVAEGYTLADESKLKKDLERFSAILFRQQPYQSFRNNFNVYGIWKPSENSGCNEPGYGSFKNTAIHASFDSLGSERYLLVEDNRNLRDIAGHVPYDAMLIMVNHQRYGGGGIYNLYCTFTIDNPYHEYLILHEFGHSFSGLADEYYTSQVAYNDFYPQGIEPLEPNITALLDPGSLKWKNLVERDLAIPTPWEKEAFDTMDLQYQKIRQTWNSKIARARREGKPANEIAAMEKESTRLSLENTKQTDNFLKNSRYFGKVGVYEGAGYAAHGLYRPMIDCLMFSRGIKPYCKVCEAAVSQMIQFYSE